MKKWSARRDARVYYVVLSILVMVCVCACESGILYAILIFVSADAFPKEKEITFPPYTMLVVEPVSDDDPRPRMALESGEEEAGKPGCVVAGKPGCVRFTVKPHFI